MEVSHVNQHPHGLCLAWLMFTFHSQFTMKSDFKITCHLTRFCPAWILLNCYIFSNLSSVVDPRVSDGHIRLRGGVAANQPASRDRCKCDNGTDIHLRPLLTAVPGWDSDHSDYPAYNSTCRTNHSPWPGPSHTLSEHHSARSDSVCDCGNPEFPHAVWECPEHTSVHCCHSHRWVSKISLHLSPVHTLGLTVKSYFVSSLSFPWIISVAYQRPNRCPM